MATNWHNQTQSNFNSIYYQNPCNKKIQQQQPNMKRSESVSKLQKSFSPYQYEQYDREKMQEEMTKLLKEIQIKTKAYQSLRNSHNESESQNLKTIKLIESLISDCKQIQIPIEKSNSTNSLNNGTKNKSLLNNLKETLASYQQTLLSKEKQLTELKVNNPKILRLFEIESKLIDANETYEMIFMQYTNLARKITNLDQDSQKAIEARDTYKASNAKLKQENDELKGKIALNENENCELILKEQFFEERIAMIQGKYSELKTVLKDKEESLERSKSDMIKFKSLANEKDKSEAMLNSQLKQIQMLKDQSDKKSKQVKELEKSQNEYLVQLNELKSNGKIPSSKLYATQKDKKIKDEEYDRILQEIEQLQKEREELLSKYAPKAFEIQTQINYSLNIPLTIYQSNIA